MKINLKEKTYKTRFLDVPAGQTFKDNYDSVYMKFRCCLYDNRSIGYNCLLLNDGTPHFFGSETLVEIIEGEFNEN